MNTKDLNLNWSKINTKVKYDPDPRPGHSVSNGFYRAIDFLEVLKTQSNEPNFWHFKSVDKYKHLGQI